VRECRFFSFVEGRTTMGIGWKHHSRAQWIVLLKQRLARHGLSHLLSDVDIGAEFTAGTDPEELADALHREVEESEPTPTKPEASQPRPQPLTSAQRRALSKAPVKWLPKERIDAYHEHQDLVTIRDDRQAEPTPPDRLKPQHEGGIGDTNATSRQYQQPTPGTLVNNRPLTVLICGDRHWTDKTLLYKALNRFFKLHHVIRIILGGARGADSMTEAWATTYAAHRTDDLAIVIVPAEWDRLGPSAGPIRNKKMLAMRPDVVLAFHKNLDASKGTKNTVKLAHQLNVPVYIIPSKPPKPPEPPTQPYLPHLKAKHGHYVTKPKPLPNTDRYPSEHKPLGGRP
jgi:hypothetical protein